VVDRAGRRRGMDPRQDRPPLSPGRGRAKVPVTQCGPR
jgi:hypothetical protein